MSTYNYLNRYIKINKTISKCSTPIWGVSFWLWKRYCKSTILMQNALLAESYFYRSYIRLCHSVTFFAICLFAIFFYSGARSMAPLIPGLKKLTMKVFLICMILVLPGLLTLAQAPQQFSFQGVARKADGKVAVNATIGVRITIHSETAGGAVVYQETAQPSGSTAK